jgi:hypothetical protein
MVIHHLKNPSDKPLKIQSGGYSQLFKEHLSLTDTSEHQPRRGNVYLPDLYALKYETPQAHP